MERSRTDGRKAEVCDAGADDGGKGDGGKGSNIKSQFLSSPGKRTTIYAIPANEPNKP